jgi:hypothetical protein
MKKYLFGTNTYSQFSIFILNCLQGCNKLHIVLTSVWVAFIDSNMICFASHQWGTMNCKSNPCFNKLNYKLEMLIGGSLDAQDNMQPISGTRCFGDNNIELR